MAITSNFSQSQWAVEGIYGPGYISPTALLAERDIRKKIFNRYHEDDLFEFLLQSGRKETSANTKFSWFEHDALWHVATVSAKTGTNGDGNAATITLTTGTGDHLSSGSKSLFKDKDIVGVQTAAAGLIKGYVTATDKTTDNAHTVTIQPKDDENLVGNVSPSDKVFLITDAAADGTKQPASKSRKPIEFSSYTQIIKNRFKVSGGESANKATVDIKGKPYYYLQGVMDAITEQKMKINYAFLLGMPSDGSEFTDPVSGDPVYMSDSLESVVDERGNIQTYSSYAIGDVQDLVKTWSRQRAAKSQMMLTGINLDVEIDEFAKDYLDDTAIDYSAWGKGNKSMKAVDFGFSSIYYAGYCIMKQRTDALDYLGSTGFSTSQYPDLGFTIPLDMVKSKGKLIDTITVMTKANDRESRYMKEDVKNLFTQTDGEDAYAFDHFSEVGLRLVGANQMVKIQKS